MTLYSERFVRCYPDARIKKQLMTPVFFSHIAIASDPLDRTRAALRENSSRTSAGCRGK